MSRVRIARLTPPGTGGIAVLHVIGPGARDFLAGRAPIPRAGRARYGRLVGEDRFVDEVLVVEIPPEESFTGEPTLEITTHGGPRIVSEILQWLVSRGAVPVDRVELRAIARRRGRIDGIAEEALANLETARTERAARFFLEALEGALRRELEALARETDARILDAGLTALVAGARLGLAFAEPPSVVLLGPPNVGKSSLLNRLARRDAAIVTAEPGTTRDLVEVEVAIRGIPIRLIDGAGLRRASGPIEAEGVRRMRAAWSRAALALFLVETGGPFPDPPAGAIPVRTKVDLTDPAPGAPGPAAPRGTVHTSAVTGRGIEALEERIVRVLVGEVEGPPDRPAPFTARQLEAVARGRAALAAGRAALDVARGVLIECAGPDGDRRDPEARRTENGRGESRDP